MKKSLILILSFLVTSCDVANLINSTETKKTINSTPAETSQNTEKIIAHSGEGFETTELSKAILQIERIENDFSHQNTFDLLAAPKLNINTELYENQQWYQGNYNMAKYGGYHDLYNHFEGYLPTGKNLTILQAEKGSTPDVDYVESVKHLVNFRASESDSHAENVTEILSSLATYPGLFTQYETYSPNLDRFHTIDTADLRTFIGSTMSEGTPYFVNDYQGNPITPAQLLNVSNTNGGSSIMLVNQMDRFINLNNLVACTAMSSLESGNWTTSGTQYNSLVVDYPWGSTEGYEKFNGSKVNSHGVRQKPDLTAFSQFTASSYSTPTVCSGAALLLERVYKDDFLTNAKNSIVIKSIIMAGATRFNYKYNTEWDKEGVSQAAVYALREESGAPIAAWQRVSDENPLSQVFGAGVFNIYTAYLILDTGEWQDNQLVGERGWSYKDDIEENKSIKYYFRFNQDVQFSSLLAWHREITQTFDSILPDYKITLNKTHSDGDLELISVSDSTTNNIELIDVMV